MSKLSPQKHPFSHNNSIAQKAPSDNEFNEFSNFVNNKISPKKLGKSDKHCRKPQDLNSLPKKPQLIAANHTAPNIHALENP